jgi:hypothetical protein
MDGDRRNACPTLRSGSCFHDGVKSGVFIFQIQWAFFIFLLRNLPELGGIRREIKCLRQQSARRFVTPREAALSREIGAARQRRTDQRSVPFSSRWFYHEILTDKNLR